MSGALLGNQGTKETMLGETEGVNTRTSRRTKVFNTFRCTDAKRRDYGVLVRKFEGYCTPCCKEMWECYIFRPWMQKEVEPFKNHFWDLQLKVELCNFASLTKSMMRDQNVYCAVDKELQECTLRGGSTLEFSSGVQLSKTAKLMQTQKKAREAPEHLLVPVSTQQKDTRTRKCSRCSRQHKPRRCPVYGGVRSKRQKKNHRTVCCG